MAMEYVVAHSWHNLWIECDSSAVIQAFNNVAIIPFRLRNRWHNVFHGRIQAICSHVYREGNCCADKLDDFGHSIMGSVWVGSLPRSLVADFFHDRVGLPNYRFP